MIVVCPTCATRHDVPESHFGPDGTMMSCAVCGHGWIESRALSIIEPKGARASYHALEVEEEIAWEREVQRLAQAALRAEAQYAQAKLKRRKELRGWAMLIAAIIFPAGLAFALPNEVAGAFPAAQLLYAKAGIAVNASGLEFRNVGQQHSLVDGVRVLAIQGEIVNVGKRERPIPVISFTLKDEKKTPVYDWRLTATTRPVKPGEVSTFVTRIASPPEAARHVEIRFAPHGERGSNAGHENGAH
jgi:predicted Zn finger-like uncharacterized protein